MKSIQVYDWPTRIFHWMFAGLFLTAFLIAKNVDDESSVFSIHMLLGLTLGFLTFLRILWGFAGSRHARFSGFALQPRNLVHYIKGVFSGSHERWAGHNPASSWTAILMMISALGLATSGYLMATGSGEEFEDIHELLANGFILLVGLHVAGIVFHTLRLKDLIGLSMLTGRKVGVPEREEIANSHGIVGALLFVTVLTFGFYLYQNYDSDRRSLQFLGQTLELGEPEEAGGPSMEHQGSDESLAVPDDEDDD